ncbi:MAG: hypothetical protein HUJ65_01240, partial [Oscillospiraceae bacterium]|nr:hypothetical protein [Oscillospiraceae bacterium]
MKFPKKTVSIVLAAAVLAVTLCSCSKTTIDSDIIGKWVCSTAYYEGEEINMDLTFKYHPTLMLDGEARAELSVEETECDFKWSAEKGKITLKLGRDEYVGTYTDKEIKFDDLVGIGMVLIPYADAIAQDLDIVIKGNEQQEHAYDWDDWSYWDNWLNWGDYGEYEEYDGKTKPEPQRPDSGSVDYSDSFFTGTWVSTGLKVGNKTTANIFGYDLNGTIRLKLNADGTTHTSAFGYDYEGVWEPDGENGGSATSEGNVLAFVRDGDNIIFEYCGMNIVMVKD